MSGVKTPPTQGHLAGKLKGVTDWRGSVGVKIFIFQSTSGDLSHIFNKLQSFPGSLGMLECYCLAVNAAASPDPREHWGHYHFVAIWGTDKCVVWFFNLVWLVVLFVSANAACFLREVSRNINEGRCIQGRLNVYCWKMMCMDLYLIFLRISVGQYNSKNIYYYESWR